MTGASDANHSLAYTYDALGRVTGKGQTIGTVNQSIGYGFSNGQLTTMALPSGQLVTYGYNDNNQVISVRVGSTMVLSNALYDPFGPVRGWTWGNGTLMSRSYDTDGKLAQFVSGGLKTYAYDDAFRITGITDAVVPANSWTYGYDGLDRITSATKTGMTLGWTYDANGNRLTQTGSSASTFTIASSSNKISSVSGSIARTYSYDASGNTTGYSTATATYNNRGRMKTLTKASVTASYVYSVLGQLIKQGGGPSSTVLYMYDEAGHLVGEYTSTGALIQETVWLGDIPIATLRPNGAALSIYYVHTDHLNTPVRVTRPSDNVLMWMWYASPFGTDSAIENPAGGGTFNYNLRMAGQLYDTQAGLHQNTFRDYDPLTGRYLESDLVGLRAGINTYLYVGANPVSFIDPFGLTREDIDAMVCFARRMNPDLEIPYPIVDDLGYTRRGDKIAGETGRWPWSTTYIDSMYLKHLDPEGIFDLYNTIIHESWHYDKQPFYNRGSMGSESEAYAEGYKRSYAVRKRILTKQIDCDCLENGGRARGRNRGNQSQ